MNKADKPAMSPNSSANPDHMETRSGFPFGIACDKPLFSEGDNWWRPMSDEEVEAWLSEDRSEG